MLQSGIEYFLTQKLSWNLSRIRDRKRSITAAVSQSLPVSIIRLGGHRWSASRFERYSRTLRVGSRVLTHFPPADTCEDPLAFISMTLVVQTRVWPTWPLSSRTRRTTGRRSGGLMQWN